MKLIAYGIGSHQVSRQLTLKNVKQCVLVMGNRTKLKSGLQIEL